MPIAVIISSVISPVVVIVTGRAQYTGGRTVLVVITVVSGWVSSSGTYSSGKSSVISSSDSGISSSCSGGTNSSGKESRTVIVKTCSATLVPSDAIMRTGKERSLAGASTNVYGAWR